MATKDRKGVAPSVPISEEEQTTFGQQSPYAAGFNNNDPAESSAYFPINSPSIPPTPTASSSNQPSTVTSPQQQHQQQQIPRPATAPPPIPMAIPIEQDAHYYPDDQPPAYDEVARPAGAPQGYYGNNNNQGYNNPTAPLLPSGPPADSYSAIPPATPYTPGSPRSIYGGPDDGSRRFNKFWLIFLAVVVLLSITVDDDKEVDDGNCGAGFTRSILTYPVQVAVNNMEITSNGIVTTVILEQREHSNEEPNNTHIVIFATGRDRNDLEGIGRNATLDPTTGRVQLSIAGEGDAAPNNCLSATIRVSIPPNAELIHRVRILVDEGNVTLAMRQPGRSLLIKDLYTRVVTGYMRIDANVTSMQLGGGDGMIEGNIVVGQSITVKMVEGDVSLNVTQSSPTVDGKIDVTSGNIDVGLMTPYIGTFRLEAGSGSVDIHNVDFSKTRVKFESDKTLKGWRSEQGTEPRGRVSSLKLAAHVGRVELDMARQIDP
ncbi:MAG: hypothetical protein J3R72DRAFT_440098 [Linnemannia gamsii]|nr:MAG: hypothetical protein J3R72DRAFT_440098 [Linnemannia gamsii]